MASANPAVFGDFSSYLVGVDRDIEITTDQSAGFATDQTIVKARVRVAGGLAKAPRYANNTTYTSTVYATISTY